MLMRKYPDITEPDVTDLFIKSSKISNLIIVQCKKSSVPTDKMVNDFVLDACYKN